MEYSIELLQRELSRVKKKIDDENGYLENSQKYVAQHTETLEHYKLLLEELQTAINRLETIEVAS